METGTWLAMAPPLPPLTPEQVSRFKTEGYLIIPPGALDEELLAAAQEMMWTDKQCGLARVPRLERGDPASWSGGFTEAEIAEAQENDAEPGSGILGMLPMNKHHMGLRELGSRELFLKLLPQRLWPWAEQLVGEGKLVYPDGVRSPLVRQPLSPGPPRRPRRPRRPPPPTPAA